MRHLLLFLAVVLICTARGWTKEISNGRKPSSKAYTIQFTEDLKFGADEEGDEYLWALPTTSVSVDSRGNIFVADTKEGQLFEFDNQGKFLRVAVKKGQGPGEVQFLSFFQILPDGESIALSSAPGSLPVLHFFDKELNFLEQKTPQGTGTIPGSIYFSPLGKIFASTYVSLDFGKGEMVTKTGVLDRDFNVIKEFTEYPQEANFQRFSDPAYVAEFIANAMKGAFRGVGVVTFDPKGNIYSAVSNQYVITKWNADMSKALLVIKRDYKPIPNTQENIEAVVEKTLSPLRGTPGIGPMITDAFLKKVVELAGVPLVKNPIGNLLHTEKGQLLVVHDINAATGVQMADIYSAKGKFIGQVTLHQWAFLAPNQQPRMVFRNGFAYTVLTDEYDDNRVVRYRYELVPRK